MCVGSKTKKSAFSWKTFPRYFVNLLIACLICNASGLENYDFIIAGGGTAGLAVARRLAEGGQHSVLVLESGGLSKKGMDVPALAHRFTADYDVTFQYRSTPQQNAGLRRNGVISVYSGRMLSGTSNLNYMMWNRGHPSDFDNWGNLTQDSGWNYSNMLKYFKRSESYAGDFPSDQHGFTGPITVSRPRYAPGLEQWLSAGKYLGYPVTDPNGPQQSSFTPVDYAKRRGRRCSAFVGYIQPILASTPKLKIILNTNVTQIIFEGKRAVGVRFHSTSPELHGIQDNCLYVNKEIIVSAGVYGSPQILMRSGIGPKNVLRPSRIPIIQELPVGQNFHDHVGISVPVLINKKELVLNTTRDLTPRNWQLFNKFGDGPYSSTIGFLYQAFLVSPVAKSDGEGNWPDVHLTPMASADAFAMYSPMSINDSSIAPWEAPMICGVLVSRPKSRGSIRLDPRDPQNGLPILDVGYLEDSRDIEKALYGVKQVIRVYEETPAFRKLGGRIPFVDIPMCRPFPFRTDDYWRCFIRHASGSAAHPAGSCRMGRGASDPDAVVDTKLRVIGVEGLRVVDASIMPAVVNANTHAAVYAIAEKASEMILDEWQSSHSFTRHI